MSTRQPCPAAVAPEPIVRRAAARLGGITLYLGPCRRRQLVMQAQVAALEGDDDDLDDVDDLEGDGAVH